VKLHYNYSKYATLLNPIRHSLVAWLRHYKAAVLARVAFLFLCLVLSAQWLTPVAASSFQPTRSSLYATFYYPWYGNPASDGGWAFWEGGGHSPAANWLSNYLPLPPGAFNPTTQAMDPTIGLYSSRSPSNFYWQISQMAQAHLEVAISSWWGRSASPTSTSPGLYAVDGRADYAFRQIVTNWMNLSDNPYPNLRWALYYEKEGFSDPSLTELVSDLQYIRDNYLNQPSFLTIGGRPVIFVYAQAADGCPMADRWAQARAQSGVNFYIVLKLFSGYQTCATQPDSWHQYAPAVRSGSYGTYSSFISPGFWPTSSTVTLPRNPTDFETAAAAMVSASTYWKLVETWNEWGEGTSVEPGIQVKQTTSGSATIDPNGIPFQSTYIDILGRRLPALQAGTGAGTLPPPTSAPTSVPTNTPTPASAPPPTGSFVFGAGGDFGANPQADASLRAIPATGASFFLAVGDLDYDQTTSDAAWCDYVKQRVGSTFPFELVTGNHEEGSPTSPGPNGYIGNFAACLPDYFNAKPVIAGQPAYPGNYYFDYPPSAPLMRVIMISANLTYNGVQYNFNTSEQTNYNALAARIDEAKQAGLWVAVGMHKVCITVGDKSCEIGPDLMNLLIRKKVDLVLQGHDHNYQRSKQIALGTSCTSVVPNAYNAGCVVDDGSDNQYITGAGTLFVINGLTGRCCYATHPADSEAGYFARMVGSTTTTTSGFVAYTVSSGRIDARVVNTVGSWGDSFSLVSGNLPPPPTPTLTPTKTPTTPTPTLTSTKVPNTPTPTSLSPTSTPTQAPNTPTPPTLTPTQVPNTPTPPTLTPTQVSNTPTPPTLTPTQVPNTPTTTPLSPTATLTPTPVPAATQTPVSSGAITVNPVADAYVNQSNPGGNYGANIAVRTDASPIFRTYMRFQVPPLSGTVVSATLRIYANSASSMGYTTHSTISGWGERTITYSNAPAFGGDISSSGPIKSATWTAVDVTALVNGAGEYNLVMTSPSATATSFSSREGVNRPQLIVNIAATSPLSLAEPLPAAPVEAPTDTLAAPLPAAPIEVPTATLAAPVLPGEPPTATLVQPIVNIPGLMTVESDSPVVQMSAGWGAVTEPAGASGGSYLVNSQPATTLSLPFQGATAGIAFLQGPSLGKFAVEVDSTIMQVVDTNAPNYQFAQVTFPGLADGAHTLKILATEGTVGIDAFLVSAVGSPPPETLVPSEVPPVEPTVQPTQSPQGPAVLIDVQPAAPVPGQAVNVDFYLYNVANLYGLQATCQVDPAVLTGTMHSSGDAFPDNSSYFVDTSYQPDGTWTVAASLLRPTAPISGSMKAFTLSYNVLTAGDARLTCSVIAVDPDGNLLPVEVSAGSLNIGAIPNPTVEPTIEPTIAPIIEPTVAPIIEPTVEPTIEPTAVPAPTGTVSGVATFQNRPDNSGINVRLYSTTGNLLAEATTDSTGSFAFSGVAPGDYKLLLRAPENIPLIVDANIGSDGAPLDTGTVTLQSGDVDDNGVVDVLDATLIGANFGVTAPPAPVNADLNGDQAVNIADLVLIGSNFGAQSPLVQSP
jgi:glycosyl hydrolase family 99/SdrD B-like protein/calcineurin-like phosphoesterase family protein/dockerin type I repeat protein